MDFTLRYYCESVLDGVVWWLVMNVVALCALVYWKDGSLNSKPSRYVTNPPNPLW